MDESNKKVVVYLADLANTYFGCSPSTVPLAAGYLKAYALEQLPHQVEIKLFRTFESLWKAVQQQTPDLVGCSWYGWNRCLTTNALKFIKEKHPQIITFVGGANTPEKPADCLKDFREFPQIDFMIPNEGEIPFVNLLQAFLQNGWENIFQKPLSGVFHLNENQKIVTGNPIPLVQDINIFPSPYLGGHLDHFLAKDLMPVIQTGRGCPYQCAFCVSAKHSWNKIRAFNLERTKQEVNYLENKAKIKTIRFADENWGLLPSDLELARFIAEKRTTNNYPDAIRVYTDKHITPPVKEIISLLKDILPMNISTQTMTSKVLKNIHRVNITDEEMKEAISWAHHHNINATTELIFGLPGETYQSFMETIDKLISLRYDGIGFGTLMLHKEIELSTPEIMNQYDYKIIYSVSEGGYTKTDEFESIELDFWAASNNTFNSEDFIRISLFNMVYNFFMGFCYLKEAVFMWENRGIKLTEVISELLDHPEKYPFFSQQLTKQRTCLQNNLFATSEEARQAFRQQLKKIQSNKDFMSQHNLPFILIGEMLHPHNQHTTLQEIFNAAHNLFQDHGFGNQEEFLKEQEFAKTLVQQVITPFWEVPQETVTLLSHYDLIAWRNQDYKGTLSQFVLPQPQEYQFKINSLGQYLEFVRLHSNKPFAQQAENFFRTFRTANVRRYLVSHETS